MIGTFSSMATSAFSLALGNSKVTFTPNGLSVSDLISLMMSFIWSGVLATLLNMPRAPALETAATMLGRLTKAIPASIMGCSMPNSSVILVLIGIPPLLCVYQPNIYGKYNRVKDAEQRNA